ncbi:MAG: hypothetical protein LBI62_00310, partial [Candidatus Accumulibacter sp.]|nr:hypothetical protein [Accumulibacter sp.]
MHYVQNQLKSNMELPLASAVKVERLPQHGTLDIGYASQLAKQAGDNPLWRYTPDPGFIGTDQATFLIDDPRNEKLCNPWTWMISDANSVPGIPNFSFSSFSGASLVLCSINNSIIVSSQE